MAHYAVEVERRDSTALYRLVGSEGIRVEERDLGEFAQRVEAFEEGVLAFEHFSLSYRGLNHEENYRFRELRDRARGIRN